jgi:hypothetical protein
MNEDERDGKRGEEKDQTAACSVLLFFFSSVALKVRPHSIPVISPNLI